MHEKKFFKALTNVFLKTNTNFHFSLILTKVLIVSMIEIKHCSFDATWNVLDEGLNIEVFSIDDKGFSAKQTWDIFWLYFSDLC